MNQHLVDEIYSMLITSGRKWRIGGELKAPTREDILTVLDRLSQAVYDGEVGTQAQTGGILVQRDEEHYDVYIHIGEYTHDYSND